MSDRRFRSTPITVPHGQLRALFAVLQLHSAGRGRGVTLKEISDALAISKSGAVNHLAALWKKGLVAWEPKIARSIRPVVRFEEMK